MLVDDMINQRRFYDNSILSGTKIRLDTRSNYAVFYDNSILSGTKISNRQLP